MPAIFLTRSIGAEKLSSESEDRLIDAIRDAADVVVLPEGWGIVFVPQYEFEEEDEYDEDEEEEEEDSDYDPEDSDVMDGREED